MSRSGSWTPHQYPLQSSPPPAPQQPPEEPLLRAKTLDSITSSSTSQVSGDVPKIPRNIRALKDGQNGKVTGRTIIVCLDGTGDKFDADNSNIVHLVACFKKSDPAQIIYYQSGIGTYDGGGLSNGFRAGMDMAVGSGLGVHIRDAYRFIMQNYHENDRICLFGFSRGAYTARCLGGMIHKVGLLPAHNISQVQFAYQYYKDDSPEGWKMSSEFKRTFCVDISVYFIGVFDSVASVGFIPRRLPLSSTPFNKATYFRHAMALDEHRAKFKVCQFQRRDTVVTAKNSRQAAAQIHEDAINGRPARSFSATLGVGDHRKTNVVKEIDEEDHWEADPFLKRKKQRAQANRTDALEVWFTGAHADVGGGAVKNEERHKLAQIPLRWMIRQCFLCDTGIIFATHRLAEEGLDVHTLWPTYQALEKPSFGPPPSMLDKYEHSEIAPISRRATVLKPLDEADQDTLLDVELWKDEKRRQLHQHWVPEQVEDYFDAISPINDQLVVAKGWWILEAWPIKVRIPDEQGREWIKKVDMNRGRYRPVLEEDPNLHWTVQQRMEAKGYQNRVRLLKHAAWNIVV